MKSFIKRLGRSNIDAWKCIFKHGCRERIKKFSVIYKAIFDFCSADMINIHLIIGFTL